MRKLILETQVSVDGFIADANGRTDWMVWNWGPEWTWDKELQDYHTQLTKSVGTILISRQMAEEGFNGHWKQAGERENDARFDFAKHVTDLQKIVFTKTINKSMPIPGGWDNTDIAEGDSIDFVTQLKKRKGGDMIVYGGASLVSSLIKAELIDELHLLVNPVAIGSGLSFFSSVSQLKLELIRSKSFDCGVALLHYQLRSSQKR